VTVRARNIEFPVRKLDFSTRSGHIRERISRSSTSRSCQHL
jgi:hypothetical protein